MGKTILVADDSKTMRHVVSLTFRTTDFDVVGVASGDEALAKIREVSPDIVLADVAMPGKDGYALCSAIKGDAGTAGLPVLLLTGASEPFDEGKAQAARADGHIKKPFDTESLITMVKDLVASGARAPQAAGNGEGAAPQPFAAPRGEAAPAAAMSPAAGLEDALPVAGAGGPPGGPTLEPPTPPAEVRARANIDPWALAEPGPAHDGGASAVDEISIDEAPAARAVGQIAQTAAAPVAAAAAAATGASPEQLTAAAREIIERIAWEVVPELAETIIRAELKRLLSEA